MLPFVTLTFVSPPAHFSTPAETRIVQFSFAGQFSDFVTILNQFPNQIIAPAEISGAVLLTGVQGSGGPS